MPTLMSIGFRRPNATVTVTMAMAIFKEALLAADVWSNAAAWRRVWSCEFRGLRPLKLIQRNPEEVCGLGNEDP